MGTKDYSQLTPQTDVQDGDLLASFRGAGPLKRITASILQTYFGAKSLLLDGTATMLNPAIGASNGTAAAPAWTFAGSPDTGTYAPAASQFGAAAGGIQRLFMTSAGGGIYGAVAAKSSGYTVLKNDVGALFSCTSTFTLTLTAAATLTSGHWFAIHNAGTGFITIDPNGSEQIDGRATIIVYPGENFVVYCTGTEFLSVGRSRVALISNTTTASVASLELTDGITDTEFTAFRVDLQASGGSSGADALLLALKTSSYSNNHFYSRLGATFSLTSVQAAGGQNLAGVPLTLNNYLVPAQLRLSNLTGAAGVAIANSVTDFNTGTNYLGTAGCATTGTALTAIRFSYASTNIDSGSTFRLWGER